MRGLWAKVLEREAARECVLWARVRYSGGGVCGAVDEGALLMGGQLWRRCEFVRKEGEMDRRFLSKCSEDVRLRKRSKSDKSPL